MTGNEINHKLNRRSKLTVNFPSEKRWTQKIIRKKHDLFNFVEDARVSFCVSYIYIILQDEFSVGKESDEEDNEGARQRREQLTALKEAAYELLGKAWPKDSETQGKLTT